MSSPSIAQVREQVVVVRQRVRDARVIGIRADEWSGPDVIEVDRVPFRIAFCESPLHVREELLELQDGAGLIVLTPASEDALGSDVMVRLAKRHIFDIDTWRIALALFKASVIDPRLQRARWLADALVESAPPGGYESVPAGVLDADTVWDALLRYRVGLPDGRPDAVALLRWAETPTDASRYTGLPTEFRQAVRARVRETAGVVGETMLDALETTPSADLVVLGLACRVLFAPEDGVGLRDAAIRFERFHHHHPLPPEVGLQWAEAAERVIAERESADGWPAVRPRADRADRLLTELGAGSFLHLGRWSPGGFEQRMTRLAGTIANALGQSADVGAVESAAASVLDNRLARVYPVRQRRVEMARRLVRWLQSPTDDTSSLVDAIQTYCQQGAFVDLARLVLLGGEQPAELGSAYAALLARVRERRERENEAFGRLVAATGAQPPEAVSVVPVERVLDTVVAPLARAMPVFMLVMDGLSRPVYQDLLQSLADAGWQCWEPAQRDSESRRWAAFAALPSITEVSRTSLFAGRLIAGDAATEAREFAAHPGLQHVSRSRRPPVLFHKSSLLSQSGRGLSDEVRTALLDGDQRIVAAVVNVVDDLLFKGDQIHPRWDLDAAPVVKELLDAARIAGRAIVLTSDHGHLLDDDTAFPGREAGDRWREDTSAPGEGEVRVEGRRVLAKGRSSIIVPWSERTRYSGKKNGYHGGVSPQEVVLPLAVLTWGEGALEGFREVANVYPPWWFEASATPPSPPRPARPTATVKPAKPTPTMFDLMESDQTPAATPSWLDRLFASRVLLDQKALSQGRGLPPDDEVRRLLLALSERGGRMTRVALAQRLGVPPFRLTALLAATRRLLNVDGLQVLAVDDASATVILNRLLLEQQFEIDAR